MRGRSLPSSSKLSLPRHQRKDIALLPFEEYPAGNRGNLEMHPAAKLSRQGAKPRRTKKKRRSSAANKSGKVVAFPLRSRRSRQLPLSAVIVLRILILGLGLSAIAGTILYILDANRFLSSEETTQQSVVASEAIVSEPEPEPTSPPAVELSEEITQLKTQLESLAAPYTHLQPKAFFVDLDTGRYVSLAGEKPIAAASTIKIPVLIAFFQAVDAGEIRLDEELTMTPELIGGGSGGMQYQKPGSKYSALYTATQMIVVSDNTATNMIIDRLGGIEAVNEKFQSWGLEATVIHNPLPDLEGTNQTSSQELVEVLARVSKGELVSLRSRDRILSIMSKTRTNTLLPQGLGPGAAIAHKTGDIGSMVGDAGIVDMPSGKRYLGAVMVNRPHNDAKAKDLIRAYSKAVYDYFEQIERDSFVSSSL